MGNILSDNQDSDKYLICVKDSSHSFITLLYYLKNISNVLKNYNGELLDSDATIEYTIDIKKDPILLQESRIFMNTCLSETEDPELLNNIYGTFADYNNFFLQVTPDSDISTSKKKEAVIEIKKKIDDYINSLDQILMRVYVFQSLEIDED